MIACSKNTEIFCLVDKFCNEYDEIVENHLPGDPSKHPSTITKSELITIMIPFPLRGYRTFKQSIFLMFKNISKMISQNSSVS